MKRLASLLVVTLAGSLAACATPGSGPGGEEASQHHRGRQLRELKTLDCNGAVDCAVPVTVQDFFDPKSANAEYETVVVRQGKKVQITWALPYDPKDPSRSCYFYPQAGDGVFYKRFGDDLRDFERQFAIDDPKNPKEETFRSRWYQWFSKNQLTKSYQYVLIFHCGAVETAFRVDPAIFNEGP